ncbi:ATP-binding protein [Paenibacillus qinlingensis]|uniref:ATP-binding protein n=1 Tax=Paenibacillus qinlingensis TaxID=1837343 RepID=UPI0015663686|nr:ATP-binding protein [Paenibacillus qinlingensis]NQX62166.1 ATP-binding protein [Paenibacillus qinlingensis]
MNTKCIIENPACDGLGQIIIDGDVYDFCSCTDIHKAYELYKQSGAEISHMLFPSQLTHNPVIQTQVAKPIRLLDLLEIHDRELKHMIDHRWHLIFISDTGYGKTQYVSTLLLMAAYRKYRSIFIDLRKIREWLKDKNAKPIIEAKLAEADIIVLDDIGVENYQDFEYMSVMNKLDSIIRTHKGLLIVTSNYKIADMKKAYLNTRIPDALLKGDTKIYAFLESNLRQRKSDPKIDQIP